LRHPVVLTVDTLPLMGTGIFSGRYWVNISDTLLVGEFHQWKEADLTATTHRPGLFLPICQTFVGIGQETSTDGALTLCRMNIS